MGLPNARRDLRARSARSSGSGSSRPSLLQFSSGGSGGSRSIYNGVRTEGMSDADAITAIQDIEDARATKQEESTPDDRAASALVRLLSSPDAKGKQKGIELLQENADLLKPETAKKYGLTDAISEIKAAQEAQKKAEDQPAWKKAAGYAAGALEVIGRPQQAVMELLQGAAVDTGLLGSKLDKDQATPELLAYEKEQQQKGGYKDAWRAITGDDRFDATQGKSTRNLGYAEALGVDSRTEFGDGNLRYLGQAGSFVGGAALDPLILLGGPGKGAAEKGVAAGAKVAAKDLAAEGAEGLTKNLARQLGTTAAEDISEEALKQAIRRVGMRKALTPAQRTAARQELIDAAPAALRSRIGGRQINLTPERGVSALARKATGRELRTGAEKAADKVLSTATRFDRGGLRVGQRSVVPEAVRAPVRRVLRDEIEFASPRALQAAVVTEATENAVTLTERAAKQAGRADKALERAAKRAGYDDLPETLLEKLRTAPDSVVGPDGQALTKKALKDVLKETEKAAVYADKAETFADTAARLRQAVDAEDVAKLHEIDPGLGKAAETLRTVTNPGNLSSRAKNSKVGQLAAEGLVTGTKLKRSLTLPDNAWGQVKQSLTRARSTAKASEAQMLGEISSAAQKAGNITADELTVIRDALETSGGVPVTAAALRAEGKDAQAVLLETLSNVRERDFNTLIDFGLADPLKLRTPDEYLRHSITPEGRKAMGLAENTGGQQSAPWIKASTAKASGEQAGSLKARNLMPDAKITEKNAALVSDLTADGALKAGTDVLELDPRRLVAERSLQIQKSKEITDLVDDLSTNLKDATGGELVKRVRPDEGADALKAAEKIAKRRGLQKIDLGEAGTAFAHPDIVPEIAKFMDVVGGDPTAKGIVKLLDGWNSIWKGYATVPFVSGVGFHSRNSIGNVFNNYLAGVTNPAYYSEALGIQRNMRKAAKEFPELPITEAMEKLGMDANRVALVDNALENGVINDGFFGVDLEKTDLRKIAPKSIPRRAGNYVNPASPDGMLVKWGTGIGSAIEDNARMAHFLSKVDELGDVAEATKSVKKYLFDYGDLTDFERKGLRRVNAFYTFTRKNTPLQFAELARNPAKFNRATQLEDAVLGSGDANGTNNAPAYLGRTGNSFLGKSQAGFLSPDGNPVSGGIDTPFKSALETIDPLLQTGGAALQLAAATPGLQKLVPADVADDDTPTSAIARGLLGQWSGGPAELVKIGFEEASGNSAFTGAPIRDADDKRRTNLALRLSNAIVPLIGKTEKTYNLTGKNTDSARLRLVKAITGLSVKEITPEVSESVIKGRLYDLEKALDELKAAGVNVPTIQTLRRAEVIPTPERKKRKK